MASDKCQWCGMGYQRVAIGVSGWLCGTIHIYKREPERSPACLELATRAKRIAELEAENKRMQFHVRALRKIMKDPKAAWDKLRDAVTSWEIEEVMAMSDEELTEALGGPEKAKEVTDRMRTAIDKAIAEFKVKKAVEQPTEEPKETIGCKHQIEVVDTTYGQCKACGMVVLLRHG